MKRDTLLLTLRLAFIVAGTLRPSACRSPAGHRAHVRHPPQQEATKDRLPKSWAERTRQEFLN
jgi:hypothetical protein